MVEHIMDMVFNLGKINDHAIRVEALRLAGYFQYPIMAVY